MLIATIATGLMATGATAQEHQPGQGKSTGVLDEIIVTSRKIAEDVQDVPLAVSAYNTETLQRSNVLQFDELGMRVPSLAAIETSSGVPAFIIRGIGSGGAVGTFIDEVFIARPAGESADFLDLERVEILRGPQGTLFGRNVVGGAVAIVSQKPKHALEGSAGINVGNHDRFDATGILNLPLSERVATRFAVAKRTYGGHSFNTLTDNDMDDRDSLAARASLLFDASPDLSMLLRLEHSESDNRAAWWNHAVLGPFSPPRLLNPNPRRGANQEDGFTRRDNLNVTATIEWDTAFGDFTSISSYRDTSVSLRENQIGQYTRELTDPLRFVDGHHTLYIPYSVNDAVQYSQELRLSGRPTDSLQLVGGLYFLRDEIDRTAAIKARFVFYNVDADGGNIASSDLESIAAFGQAQLSLSDRWQLTTGVRWTRDERSVHSETFGTNFNGFRDSSLPPPGLVSGWAADTADRWTAVTPMASLSFYATPDVHFFATVSRGFKSGGFAEVAPDRQTVLAGFKPEYAWDYELGVKSELFDRLRLNVNAFFLDYTDMQLAVVRQLSANLPPFGVTANAGTAEVYGLEMDWEFAMTDALRFYGSYAYNHSEIKEVIPGTPTPVGASLVHSPENKVSGGFVYTLPVTAFGEWRARVEASYQTDMFGDLANSPLTVIDSYTLLDGGLSWTSRSGSMQVELWGKNLTDELYWSTATEIPVRDVYVKYGAPRTYGVTATYRFN